MIRSVKIINDLQYLFFPISCLGCEDHITRPEYPLCVKCRHQLPLTNYTSFTDNPTYRIFFGRIQLENATSFLWFHKKGIVQNLIHHLKYRGHKKAGTFLGHWMGSELAHHQSFQHIDLVIPVPLHRHKQRSRGYNQVALFGKALAKMLNSTYSDKVLFRTLQKETQTSFGRQNRNFKEVNPFELRPEMDLHGKHILLIDDVITTGTTLESCALLFKNYKAVRLSIATMAITS